MFPAITAIVPILQGAQGLLGGNAQDAERIAANERAYDAAVNSGDRAALLFLRQRTGDYGVVEVPGYGSIGGWATDYAKTHARQKYSQALGVLKLDEVAAAAGEFVQGAAQATGNTILPGTKQELAVWSVVGIAVIFLIAFMVMRRRRRAA
jgi:hypothetical protein